MSEEIFTAVGTHAPVLAIAIAAMIMLFRMFLNHLKEEGEATRSHLKSEGSATRDVLKELGHDVKENTRAVGLLSESLVRRST